MINEQELAEAIETISEGGQALGVSCEDVYRRMIKDEDFMMDLMESSHSNNFDYKVFSAYFETVSICALKEALRAKKEVESGC